LLDIQASGLDVLAIGRISKYRFAKETGRRERTQTAQ